MSFDTFLCQNTFKLSLIFIRIRQLLELGGGPASPISLGGHQSPAPTPSTTLPRQQQRQIDINPAEFSKYKLDRPGKSLSFRIKRRK